MAKIEPKESDFLNQMVEVTTNLKVHWDETEQWWSDELHDRFEKTYIDAIHDHITLCLQGYIRHERVYGAGMSEILNFVQKALGDIKKLRTLTKLPDGTLSSGKNRYVSQQERYKTKYDDRSEKEKMIDYDKYPNR